MHDSELHEINLLRRMLPQHEVPILLERPQLGLASLYKRLHELLFRIHKHQGIGADEINARGLEHVVQALQGLEHGHGVD